MSTYFVEVPIVMKLILAIEADSKEEALEKVHEMPINIPPEVTSKKYQGDYQYPIEDYEIEHYEWDFHEKVVEGNFYHGGINEMEIYTEDEYY